MSDVIPFPTRAGEASAPAPASPPPPAVLPTPVGDVPAARLAVIDGLLGLASALAQGTKGEASRCILIIESDRGFETQYFGQSITYNELVGILDIQKQRIILTAVKAQQGT